MNQNYGTKLVEDQAKSGGEIEKSAVMKMRQTKGRYSVLPIVCA